MRHSPLFVRSTVAGFIAAALLGACGSESVEPDLLTPVAAITIEGADEMLLLGEGRTLRAALQDANGAPLADRPVEWTSSAPETIGVSPGGMLTALRNGSAEITATSGIATSSVTVTARRLEYVGVYTGAHFSCGLESSGEAWCWGNVGESGTGHGTTDPSRSDLPRRAASGSLFKRLALGERFACGIRTAGDVVCWGENESGQLGNGTTAPAALPQLVSGIAGAVDITAGAKHACALTGTGAWCWGANESGQLGDGSRIGRQEPVKVVQLSAITSLAAGYSHTCALASGEAYCWGNDDLAQLGNDTTYHRYAPVRAGVAGVTDPVYQQVIARDQHACGLTSAGKVYCWGTTISATVSHGRERNFIPVEQAPGHDFEQLFDGTVFHCGLKANGELWCWALGVAPTRFPSALPIEDAGVSYSTVCALDEAGAVSCWNPRQGAAVPVTGPIFGAIASSESWACGLATGGEFWCWSPWNLSGGAIAAENKAAGRTFTSIWDGTAATCVLTSSGDPACIRNEFEDGPAGFGFTSISGGWLHTCGTSPSGAAFCWGGNEFGQLGDNTTTDRAMPAPVAGGQPFADVSAGYLHSCALAADGKAYCWGAAEAGEMGDGNQVDSPFPVSVDGAPGLTQVKVGGGWISCGLDGGGSAHCWPVNYAREVKSVTGSEPFASLAVGLGHACGISAAGSGACWGRNSSGVFGNGQAGYPEIWEPQSVLGNIPFRFIASGGTYQSCGISTGGAAYCWGDNSGSSLGAPGAMGSEWVVVPLKLYGQE